MDQYFVYSTSICGRDLTNPVTENNIFSVHLIELIISSFNINKISSLKERENLFKFNYLNFLKLHWFIMGIFQFQKFIHLLLLNRFIFDILDEIQNKHLWRY